MGADVGLTSQPVVSSLDPVGAGLLAAVVDWPAPVVLLQHAAHAMAAVIAAVAIAAGVAVLMVPIGVVPLYLCWGRPQRRAPLVVFLRLASFRPVLGGRWTAVSGRGGAPAAKRGRTTLRPRRIRRILGWPGEQRQKTDR